MTRILLTLFLVLTFAVPAYAKDARIIQAENWFKSLEYGQSRFEQRGPDGRTLTGDFYINRPGRLRFQYDAPIKDFIVADGLMLHFYDADQQQASNAPIGLTLADFFLRADTVLGGDLQVQEVRSRGGVVSMSILQNADPAAGKLTLFFKENPFALKSWEIIDSRGLATLITLKNLRTGTPLPPSLFVFKDPSGRGRLNN